LIFKQIQNQSFDALTGFFISLAVLENKVFFLLFEITASIICMCFFGLPSLDDQLS